MIKASGPNASLEKEIQNLTERRTALVDRRAAAQAQSAEAKRARIDMLKVGGEIDKHNTVLREAGEEVASIDELLVELDAQLASSESKLAAAVDAQVRESAALVLEGLAPTIAGVLGSIDIAARRLADAATKLVDILPTGIRLVDIDGAPAYPKDYAAAVVGDALFAADAGLFEVYYQAGGYNVALRRLFRLEQRSPYHRENRRQLATQPITGTEAGKLLIVARLMTWADEIREGERSPNLDFVHHRPAPVAAPPPSSSQPVEIIAREDFDLVRTAGSTVEQIAEGNTLTLPADLSEMTITAGLAYRTGTDQARDVAAALRSGRRKGIGANGKFAIEKLADGSVISRQAVSEGRRSARISIEGTR